MSRLVFFGTPDFARQILQRLAAHCTNTQHEIVAAVCQPDKRKGRGKKLQAPPVKELAEQLNIPVFQPATLKKNTESGDRFRKDLDDCRADLGIVAAYGRIMPTKILRAPQMGCVNVHGSLLPRWRGAAPVQRAIEAGDQETGVCLMDMVYALDEGDVFATRKLRIDPEHDAESLSYALATLGADLLVEHLDALLAGTLAKSPQAQDGITYAHMLTKAEARLSFECEAQAVVNKVRAMSPWPGSSIVIDGIAHKVFGATSVPGRGAPGTVLEAKRRLVIAAEKRAVAFTEIQAPGKNRLRIQNFVAGRPIEVGSRTE